jgi:hypothetical protein
VPAGDNTPIPLGTLPAIVIDVAVTVVITAVAGDFVAVDPHIVHQLCPHSDSAICELPQSDARIAVLYWFSVQIDAIADKFELVYGLGVIREFSND